MKDKGNIEDLMKDILLSAEEEVPDRVWDGIASRLDSIAGKKRAAVAMWRRIAVISSIAAAIAAGVFLFSHRNAASPEILVAENTVTEAAVSKNPVAEDIAAESPVQESIAKYSNTAESGNKTVSSRNDKAEDFVKTDDTGISVIPVSANETSEYLAMAENPETDSADDTMESQSEHSAYNAAKQTSDTMKPVPSDEEIWEDGVELETGKQLPLSFSFSGTAVSNADGRPRKSMFKRPGSSLPENETSVVRISDVSYGLPFSVGASMKIDIIRNFGISIGVNYTLLTSRFKGEYKEYDSDGVQTEQIQSDIRNYQHYIGIPVNFYYDIIKKKHLNFYAVAGAELSKGISNEYRVLSAKITHKEKISGVQWAVNVGLGIEYMIDKNFGFYLDPSLRYYFKGNQPMSIRTRQPFQAGFELGMRVRL